MTLFEYDSEFRKQNGIFCGVDEAGRGPLAGDVYAAAVILPEGLVIEGINDSKKLSEKKREALYDEIIEKADAYCIATASVEEIDEFNILGATFIAMKRAVEGLGTNVVLALVDGNRTPPLDCNVQTLIKGDGTSASIAAASILAKVERDRYMKKLAVEYPEYQFEKHKGYGTKLHNELILKYGASPVHRKTFLRKLYAKNGGEKI
ncbi:MAG: ribonuclease HII [Oscillospiraceae bacterium]